MGAQIFVRQLGEIEAGGIILRKAWIGARIGRG